MKFKTLNLIFFLAGGIFSGAVEAQDYSQCLSIASDMAHIPPHTDQAATDAMNCVQSIAGQLATPLYTFAAKYPACAAFAPGKIYGAHNVACCLEALAADKVKIPTSVTGTLDTICKGGFGGLTGGALCTAITAASGLNTVEKYIGYICCSYCNNKGITPVPKCDVSLCLKAGGLQCKDYQPAINPQLCSATTSELPK